MPCDYGSCSAEPLGQLEVSPSQSCALYCLTWVVGAAGEAVVIIFGIMALS